MPGIISRQNYSSMGEDALVVEVCWANDPQYGIDNYPNPGAYSPKFSGEWEAMDDPKELARTAIAIRRKWALAINKPITIRVGFTGGYTLPFEEPEHGLGRLEILKWAAEKAKSLPKCPVCGEILGKEKFRLFDNGCEEEFCSEHCAEKELEAQAEFEAEELQTEEE